MCSLDERRPRGLECRGLREQQGVATAIGPLQRIVEIVAPFEEQCGGYGVVDLFHRAQAGRVEGGDEGVGERVAVNRGDDGACDACARRLISGFVGDILDLYFEHHAPEKQLKRLVEGRNPRLNPFDLGERQLGDRVAAVLVGYQGRVVRDDESAVSAASDVELNDVSASRCRSLEGGERVFAVIRGRAAMGDDRRPDTDVQESGNSRIAVASR